MSGSAERDYSRRNPTYKDIGLRNGMNDFFFLGSSSGMQMSEASSGRDTPATS